MIITLLKIQDTIDKINIRKFSLKIALKKKNFKCTQWQCSGGILLGEISYWSLSGVNNGLHNGLHNSLPDGTFFAFSWWNILLVMDQITDML